MAFTYDFAANAQISTIRMLIGDTDSANPIFTDVEIENFYAVQAATYQSGASYSGTAGATLPSSPLSYLRVAALALDAMAALKARMDLTGLQDAKTDFHGSARELREQAKQFRCVDDESGAFVMIEQCHTGFSWLDRYNRQLQRSSI